MTTTNLGEMAPEYRPGRNRSGGTLSAHRVVKVDTTAANVPNAIVSTAADTDKPYGVLNADVVNGANGDCAIRGRVRVVASGAIGVGAKIAPAAAGKVQAAVSGDRQFGEAIDAATADGDVIMAEIDCVNSSLIA